MNEQERDELLQAVVECAPKEMGAAIEYYDPTYLFVRFDGADGQYDPAMEPVLWLDKQGDHADATGIIAMLDAMEKVGHYTLLGWASDVENHYPVDGRYACQVINGKYDRVIEREGKTRAEAVVRAFVQVFGGAKK